MSETSLTSSHILNQASTSPLALHPAAVRSSTPLPSYPEGANCDDVYLSPVRRRPAFAWRAWWATALILTFATGCMIKRDPNAVQLQADDTALQTQGTRERAKHSQAELDRVTAQRDRLTAENADLKRQLDSLLELERERDRTLSESEAKARAESEAIRRELEQALKNIRLSRQQWEDDIASRQKTIDMLTSEVERLKRELQSAGGGEATTRPQ